MPDLILERTCLLTPAFLPIMMPFSDLRVAGPIILIFARDTRRPELRSTVITIGIIFRASLPEKARSSTQVEYVIPICSHSVLIRLSMVQMRMFARDVLVEAPCGRWRSKLVSLVSNTDISDEQFRTLFQSQ